MQGKEMKKVELDAMLQVKGQILRIKNMYFR